MNLHRTALLLMSTATVSAITWTPQLRSADDVNIVTTAPPSDGLRTVDEMAEYFGKSVEYYGDGVSVTVDSVETVAGSYGAGSSVSSTSSTSSAGSTSSVSSGNGAAPKMKKTSAFWSSTTSKGSATGLCLYNKGSSIATYKGSSKKSRSPKESCICQDHARNLQWANDGHSTYAQASGNAEKVSGTTSKVTSVPSKVTAVKKSGTSSNVSGSGMWAGDAHGLNKMTSGSASKLTSTKGSGSKITGTSVKTYGGGVWAGDAHGFNKMTSESASKLTSTKNSGSKVTGTSSKATYGGGVWAGDAHGVNTHVKTSKITSVKGGRVTFMESGTSKSDTKSSKTSVSATWQGDSWGPSKTSTYSNTNVYYCNCETSFEVNSCGSTAPSTVVPEPSSSAPVASSPTPNPVVPPILPVTTTPPSAAETIVVNDIVCLDDFETTSRGVAVEILVLDNDGNISSGSSGLITQPDHGLTMITDSSIMYVPDSTYCGVDMFTYTIQDSTGQSVCTASVTISVTCDATSTPISTDESNVTSSPSQRPLAAETAQPTVRYLSTLSPSNMPVDSPNNIDGGDFDIEKPIANDDFYTTNQNESVEITILFNDTLIAGTTGSYTKPLGDLSIIEKDQLVYTPIEGFCGMDMFTYTLTDATGEFSDSAVVTILVFCAPVPTTSPESHSTPIPTNYSGDDSVGVPPNYSNSNIGDDLVGVPPEFVANTVAPSTEPSLFSGDDAVGVPDDLTQTESAPELADDYATTYKNIEVFVPLLDNDVIPQDSTGTIGTPMHGEVQATPDGIIYVPTPQFCGFDIFEYAVTDSSGLYTDTAQVTIEVKCAENTTSSTHSPVGDDFVGVEFYDNSTTYFARPDLNDDFATTNQGESVVIPVLANDYIPNDSNGTFTRPNGVVSLLDGENVLYTPSEDFCGTDTFSYTITDSSNNTETAIVTIEVVCKFPDKPKCNDDYVITSQGVSVVIPATENDYVPTNATGQFEQPSSGHVSIGADGIVYAPIAEFCGFDSFNYTITDSSGEFSDSATVSIEVTCSNHSTELDALNDYINIAQDSEPVVIPVLDNDIWSDGYQVFVHSLSYNAIHGACSLSDDKMAVVYTPDEGYTGPDSCVYKACVEGEEGLCDMAVVLVTVMLNTATTSSSLATAPNSVNVHSPAHSCSTPENATVIYIVDSDPSSVIVSITEGVNGNCELTGNTTIVYSPDLGFSGTDECEYELCKGMVCHTGLLSITVTQDELPSDAETYSDMSTATSTDRIETTSTVSAETTSAVDPFSDNTPTEADDLFLHGSNETSHMCPGIDISDVQENTLLYKYQIVLHSDADANDAIGIIEYEIDGLLSTQMSCLNSGEVRRKLTIAGLVGSDSNPPDTVSDEECESNNEQQCIIVNGGLTVYGDINIQDVQDYIGSIMPDIVSAINASFIETRLITSSATLESIDATGKDDSNSVTKVAIAGTAIVAIIGAALILTYRKSHRNTKEIEKACENEFCETLPREIPRGSSNDCDTLLTTSPSFDSKSTKASTAVFRTKRNSGAPLLPSSPAFSVSSSKSKSYDIEDTVDL